MTGPLRAFCIAGCLAAGLSSVLLAQAPAPGAPQGGRGQGRGAAAPQVTSPEVSPDRTITFRIVAPQAQSVRMSASDIPNIGQGALAKKDNGVWEVTVGPVPAGAYRYNFNVDNVATLDPRNPLTSESQNNSWSLVYVPGSAFADTRNVPHGSISEVNYYSTALKADRRLHVYLPPGYETSSRKYPVFYLLHGAGDSDDSWSTVGRAGFILDNLIAEKKAKPMVVVMPAGHTRTQAAPGADAFVSDFTTDIMPLVQKNYRVSTDRASTAIAGLSMGGNQTLNIAIPNLEKFGYIGVYSSGLLNAFGTGARGGRGGAAPAGTPPAATNAATEWEKRNAAKLDDANLKKGLKVFWFATGKEDFLLDTTHATVDLFKKHGFSPVFTESQGGHTWLNWRDYLDEFAPLLF